MSLSPVNNKPAEIAAIFIFLQCGMLRINGYGSTLAADTTGQMAAAPHPSHIPATFCQAGIRQSGTTTSFSELRVKWRRQSRRAGLRPAHYRSLRIAFSALATMPDTFEFESPRASARGGSAVTGRPVWTAGADHTGSGANPIRSTSATSRRSPSTARRMASSTAAASPHNGFPAQS